MLANQAALFGLTGNSAIGVFQTLSAGNIGQLGAPGTGVPAEATEGTTPTERPGPTNPAATNATRTAVLCRPLAPPPPERPYPTRRITRDDRQPVLATTAGTRGHVELLAFTHRVEVLRGSEPTPLGFSADGQRRERL